MSYAIKREEKATRPSFKVGFYGKAQNVYLKGMTPLC